MSSAHGDGRQDGGTPAVRPIALATAPATVPPPVALQAVAASSWRPALHLNHFQAGALAGTFAATATCPLDVIKTRAQASGTVATTGYMT